jgi:hypothetical protein
LFVSKGTSDGLLGVARGGRCGTAEAAAEKVEKQIPRGLKSAGMTKIKDFSARLKSRPDAKPFKIDIFRKL